jgi:hypothetical protein
LAARTNHYSAISAWRCSQASPSGSYIGTTSSLHSRPLAHDGNELVVGLLTPLRLEGPERGACASTTAPYTSSLRGVPEVGCSCCVLVISYLWAACVAEMFEPFGGPC